MKSKQKMWAITEQRWDFSLGGMQYNVCDFGGHPILSASNIVNGNSSAPSIYGLRVEKDVP
jgi:hypothetical protein